MVQVRVDNVLIGPDTDFAALAADALGGGVFGGPRSDNYPLDAVFRAYAELRGTPYADSLARGVAAALTDPDPLVRAQALVFFASSPGAAGAARVGELLVGNLALFAGVPDPMSPGSDLAARLRSVALLVAADQSR